MDYNDFKKAIKDWPVSNHFAEGMRRALTGTGSGIAKFDPAHLNKADMKWLEQHGYTLQLNTKVEVKV